jgi:hypothetical protein
MPEFIAHLPNGKKMAFDANNIEDANIILQEISQKDESFKNYKLLTEPEETEQPEAKRSPFKLNSLESYIEDIFPSSKTNQGQIRGGLDGTKDILRFGAEGVTYPARGLGAVLNMAFGNQRDDGKYGLSEVFEKSGEGYNKYKLPNWIPGMGGEEVSPMGFLQEILHDPLGAVGPAAGKSFGTAKGILGNAIKEAGQGALQETARPLAMDENMDDYIGNILRGGITSGIIGGGKSAADLSMKSALDKIGKKIEASIPGMIKSKAHKSNVTPETLEFALNPENRELLAAAHKKGSDPIAAEAKEIFDPFHSKKFFDEDASVLREGLANVKRPIDLTPEHNRLKGLRRMEKEITGSKNLDDETLKYLSKTDNLAETLLELSDWKKHLELLHGKNIPQPKSESTALVPFNAKEAADNFNRFLADNDIAFIAGKKGIIPRKDFKSTSPGITTRSATEANNIKRKLQGYGEKAYDMKSDVVPEAAEQASRSARFVRKEVRDALAEAGEAEALDAWDVIANRTKARDKFHKEFGLGRDLDQIEKSLSKKFRNFENMSPREREILQNLDEAFGFNLSDQSRAASYAKDLAPKGLRPDEKWELAGWDKWLTGKNPISLLGNAYQKAAGDNPKAAVRNINAAYKLADVLNNIDTPSAKGMPPIYERPQIPQRLQDAPVKGEQDEARKKAVELAETLGYKPGTKDYNDMVNRYIDTLMNAKSVPFVSIGQSVQKRGEK